MKSLQRIGVLCLVVLLLAGAAGHKAGKKKRNCGRSAVW